jgi:hypothetical protein
VSVFLAWASDLEVLLTIAGVLVLSALVVATLAHRFLFAPRIAEADAHAKLLDLVHSSLLAFVAFMLAISVADVRGNFGKADDAVSREAMQIAAFDREIAEQDAAWSGPTRALLAGYVRAVVDTEWRSLAASTPSLSPVAQAALDDLRSAVRRVPARDDVRGILLTHHDRLELARMSRYENATRSIPRVFWVLIGGFLVGAMVMNGRYRQTVLTRSLVAIHFTAIGLSIALILVLDAPFRGETSIPSTPITESLRHG